jgi:serine/threonine-protein kinase
VISEIRPGVEIGGYRIEALIARGGMGLVFRATDLELGRTAAVKVLAPELAADEQFRNRFLRESRLAAAIDHPHVLPVYRAGEVEGVLYIAMRYVDGTDLASLFAREAPLPPETVSVLVSQIAAALDAAHERGLVHRDVKPGNVLVDRQRELLHCYLTDFGLTKRLAAASASTEVGHFVGSVAYAAPERVTGAAADGRADLYSLGCVAFEALTGEPPFPRDTDFRVLWAHVNDDPRQLAELRPELPSAADDAVARALAKSPADRQPTCGAFAHELSAGLGGAGVLAAPAPRQRRRLPRWALVGAAAAALVVVAVVGAALFAAQGDASDSTAEIINERVLAGVRPANRRMSDSIDRASSVSVLHAPAERLLEAVVRAQGAAGVVELPGRDEQARELVQLALVNHYGYARQVEAAADGLDRYRLGALAAVSRSTREAYAALLRAVPGLETPTASTFASADELARFITRAASPPAPPPPPSGGGCPTCAPPPPSPPPPPEPVPTHRQPPAPARLPRPATEKRLVALRPAVDLDPLVADVQAGEISLADAADRVRDDVLRLAGLKAEAALLNPAQPYAQATLLLESWIDAALRDVLAVQSWLAATRFDDPGAGVFLRQHEHRAETTSAARKAFLDEYERVSGG